MTQVTEAVNLVGRIEYVMRQKEPRMLQWPELTDCGYSNNINND